MKKSIAIETMGMVLVENIVKNALHSTMLLNQNYLVKGRGMCTLNVWLYVN